MATSPMPSPRAARTRKALLDAGFDLLADRPIDAIAIDEVVARAGVAKGSFFNHFTDKQGFAHAIGAAVRIELEERVGTANDGVADPVARLAGGMRVAVEFALTDRKRAIVMLRGLESATGMGHELNQGIRADIEALDRAGIARPETARTGVLYWLGLCQIAQVNVIERRPDRRYAAERLREMLVLGLSGLGVPEQRARAQADHQAGLLAAG